MIEKELVRTLLSVSVETGSLVCLGCGCEHDCGIHGCTIIRAAADRLAAYEDTGLEPEEINVVAGLASENCSRAADAVDKRLADDAELDAYRSIGPIEELSALVKAREGGGVRSVPL